MFKVSLMSVVLNGNSSQLSCDLFPLFDLTYGGWEKRTCTTTLQIHSHTTSSISLFEVRNSFHMLSLLVEIGCVNV